MENSTHRQFSYSVSAPGKVILFGEHSVVYGKPAVAATLGVRTRAYVQEISESKGTVRLELPQLDVNVTFDGLFEKIESMASHPNSILQIPPYEFSWRCPEGVNLNLLKETISSLTSEYNLVHSNEEQEYSVTAFLMLFVGMLLGVDLEGQLTRFGGLLIRVESDVPMRAGLGSSAAYGVSLSGALVEFLRNRTQQLGRTSGNISRHGYCPSQAPHSLSEEMSVVSQWAFISEVVMHGKPSGLDNSVCTYGSAVQFCKGKKPVSILMPSNLKVLLIDTGVPRNTLQLVASVSEKHKRLNSVISSVLDAMGSVAVEVVAVLNDMCAAGDIVSTSMSLLEELVDINQSLLKALGVSHPRLDEVVQLAATAGLHAKLTGAGGGGYAFVFLSPSVEDNRVQLLKRLLAQHNFHYTETGIAGPGVMLQEDQGTI
ncbi:mevalonate kinase [Schistocerca americana]|uniref:mevalonate kinase n=1 Tax=Schistocerca americana TaxID=7009 RepID=UPI001F4FFD33|nr:mevalonate kinase [Schistocerca americana]